MPFGQIARLEQRETQIFAGETFAASSVPHTVPELLRGHVGVHFIDNQAAWGALVCGTTKVADIGALACVYQTLKARLS